MISRSRQSYSRVNIKTPTVVVGAYLTGNMGASDYKPLLHWSWAAAHPKSIREFRQKERGKRAEEKQFKRASAARRRPVRRSSNPTKSNPQPPARVKTKTPTVVMALTIDQRHQCELLAQMVMAKHKST